MVLFGCPFLLTNSFLVPDYSILRNQFLFSAQLQYPSYFMCKEIAFRKNESR